MIIDFINHLWPFMLFLCTMVTIHEFGHYIMARRADMFVETFSIGFGPKLISFKDKNGTTWKFSLFPIGGYVAVAGEYDFSEKTTKNLVNSKKFKGKALSDATPFQKMLFAAGGPFANYISAILVCLCMTSYYGMPIVSNIIESVQSGSVAEESGLKNGDIIKSSSYDNQTQTTIEDILIDIKSGKEIILEIERKIDQNNQINNLSQDANKSYGQSKMDITKINEQKQDASQNTIPPKESEIKDVYTNHKFSIKSSSYPRKLGIIMKDTTKKVDFLHNIIFSINSCTYIFNQSIISVLSLVKDKKGLENFAGPIKIASIIKDSANDIRSSMKIFILLSLGLASMNMLPIPGLDGFTVLVAIIEMVIRKKLSIKWMKILGMIGLAIVMSFSLYMILKEIMELNVIKLLLN